MFVLVATAQVRANAGADFAQAFRNQLLPSVRSQPGFTGELLFVVPGGPEIMVITFWDTPQSASRYEHDAWPDMVECLTKIIDRPVLTENPIRAEVLEPQGPAKVASVRAELGSGHLRSCQIIPSKQARARSREPGASPTRSASSPVLLGNAVPASGAGTARCGWSWPGVGVRGGTHWRSSSRPR
jgi:Antibiotic biosynthesis monooxygenase